MKDFPDHRKPVPQVGANQIDGSAAPHFEVPSDARLRSWMAFHRGAQIPFKSTLIVTLDPEAHGIHNADQLFSIGIARSCCGKKLGHCLFKAVFLHQDAAFFDFRAGGEYSRHHQAQGDQAQGADPHFRVYKR
jgi:hypothetical protein